MRVVPIRYVKRDESFNIEGYERVYFLSLSSFVFLSSSFFPFNPVNIFVTGRPSKSVYSSVHGLSHRSAQLSTFRSDATPHQWIALVAAPPRSRLMQRILSRKGFIGWGTYEEETHEGCGITFIDSHQVLRAVLQKGERGWVGGRDLRFDPGYVPSHIRGILGGITTYLSFSVARCMRSNGSPLSFDSSLFF